MSRDTVRQFANLLAALVALTVNALAVTLPLNGLDTGEISDRFRVYFVPAGYVFSIWGIIYMGWLAFIVFQFSTPQKPSPRMRRLGYLFALSCVFNGAWLFCWHYERFGLSVLVMLALLTTLIAAYLRLNVGRVQVGALERWCVDIPFGLYLGWITVATVANISDYLYYIRWDGLGIPPQTWAVIMLAVASLLGLAMAVTRRDGAYLLVLVWAFIGIAIKQSAAALVANAAWVAAALALALAIFSITPATTARPPPNMKNFDPKYNDLPKTEIHCHLEGAIRTQTLIDVARQYKLPLPAYDAAELDRHVKVLDQWRDLHAVLQAFTIAQNSLAAPEVVGRIAWELFEDAARQNIRLFEARFSPDWAFSAHGLNWDAALDGILQSKDRAERELDMAIGLIAITSRSRGPQSCVKTVDWAIRHRRDILGIDLADSERDFPLREFVPSVMRAKDAGLKVTIHTGEDTPASFVMETIRLAAPDRIGHGIHIIQDPAAIELVKERLVTLEVNPWSNYLTRSVPRIEDHPLKQLFDLGVRVTVNSDDPEVLDTNLNNEYRIAHEVLGMSLDDLAVCNRHAFEASFIPESSRTRVWNKHFASNS